MTTLVFARLTIQEAASKKILLAAFVLGLLFLIIFSLGVHFLLSDVETRMGDRNPYQLNEIRNFLMMAGLYVVYFLSSIMIVLTSVDTISGEINSGTIQTTASKPLPRWEVVIGKWLGFMVMLTLYLLLMGGGVLGWVYLRTGYLPPNPAAGMLLIWLNALVLLSVSLLGGTRLSTLANGVLVFSLFAVAFIGGWIEQIGSYLPDSSAIQTAKNIGVVTSLVLPSEALWKRAVHELQSPLVAAIGFSPFSARFYPSNAMIVYAILFIIVVVSLAVYSFKKRDL